MELKPKGRDMKKIILIISYFVYLLIFAGLVFLLLPPSVKQDIAEVFSPQGISEEEILESSSGKYIILTFDDGWDSQFEAYKQLKQYGFKGTLYIISSLIGRENRLSEDELKTMYNDGWDICSHTVNHADLTKVSEKKAYDEVYGCSAWLKGHGFTRDSGYKHFAYRNGAYNSNITDILKQQGILSARTVNAGSDTSDPLELGRASLYGMDKEGIRDLIYSDQKLIILGLHRIVPDDTAEMLTTDLKQSYFDEVIRSIINSKRKVITITEWYRVRDRIRNSTAG